MEEGAIIEEQIVVGPDGQIPGVVGILHGRERSIQRISLMAEHWLCHSYHIHRGLHKIQKSDHDRTNFSIFMLMVDSMDKYI